MHFSIQIPLIFCSNLNSLPPTESCDIGWGQQMAKLAQAFFPAAQGHCPSLALENSVRYLD